MNMSAFQQGLSARYHDEESGGLTANPYTYDGEAQRCWYDGYSYEDDITRMKMEKTLPKGNREAGDN